ncbi:MAG: cation-translocating P-type ATPase [Ruminococcaceae bacterium]|nr:cation-translocating P-type ATPase [Oscillospiraceae bacterium]
MHTETIEQVMQTYKTDPEKGLTAEQVQENLLRYGQNVLQQQKKKPLFLKFLEQFKDAMIVILLLAAAVSFAVAVHEQESFFEPILIVAIVILNAVIGLIQENKAEKALDALRQMSSPQAMVIRHGQKQNIPASQLVPGDLIEIQAGDFVPADARVVDAFNLKAEESALTGESASVEKSATVKVAADAAIGDRFNMLYQGSGIVYGRALAVVTATGMQSEMGKIATLLSQEEETMTPLQKKLAQLGKYLGLAALIACAVIFVIGLTEGMPVIDVFMVAIALAVSAIPEGLPAIITVILAIGVQRMVKKNAIIRRLPAVETLGSASVICSDKTGTLTQNQMTLTRAYTIKGQVSEAISADNTHAIRNLLAMATLCSDATLQVDGDEIQRLGDPTETAIVYAAYLNGIDKKTLEENHPRLAELPFDSDRKMMTTVHQMDGKLTVIVKGAFDQIARRCQPAHVETGEAVMEHMSEQALRVLAVAYKTIDRLPDQPASENLENDLTFLGLVGMIDPPRPEARDAVAVCRNAGIQPIMITGDHLTTAKAIARQLDIYREGDLSISGQALTAMSQQQLDDEVEKITVYARVSPSDKIRVVKAWQKKGIVVAMTGDGVNDAPALKAADIGCAMGITGTEVAKGAADMVLTDDHFATIVAAVHEGRGIYANIKKVVGFLLGTNIGEILTVFFAMLIWKQTPLLSMQLLWINLVTDSLPAISLGMEPVEHDVMQQAPRPKDESIFAQGLGVRIAFQGLLFALLTLGGFLLGWHLNGNVAQGRTMAFLVLSLSQIIHAYNMRSHHSLFHIGWWTNQWLVRATLVSVAATLLLVLIPPIAHVFGLAGLTAAFYGYALLLSLMPLPLLELAKKLHLIKA